MEKEKKTDNQYSNEIPQGAFAVAWGSTSGPERPGDRRGSTGGVRVFAGRGEGTGGGR